MKSFGKEDGEWGNQIEDKQGRERKPYSERINGIEKCYHIILFVL